MDNIPFMVEDMKGFILNNNYKVVNVSDNYCEMVADITETSMNPYNYAHGGFIFGLADTAAGVAARATGRSAVTVNSSIDYLHAVKGKQISAIAKCIKEGRTISVYDVSVYDEQKRLVAKASVSYCYIDNHKEEKN